MSPNLTEIINLRNAADAHKKLCNENCNVSLYLLKQTAQRLTQVLSIEEKKEAAQYFIGWPS